MTQRRIRRVTLILLLVAQVICTLLTKDYPLPSYLLPTFSSCPRILSSSCSQSLTTPAAMLSLLSLYRTYVQTVRVLRSVTQLKRHALPATSRIRRDPTSRKESNRRRKWTRPSRDITHDAGFASPPIPAKRRVGCRSRSTYRSLLVKFQYSRNGTKKVRNVALKENASQKSTNFL